MHQQMIRLNIFLSETDYVNKYVDADADVAMPLTDLGIYPEKTSQISMISQKQVRLTRMEYRRGAYMAVLPGNLVYRRDIAKEVFGTTTPVEIGAKMKDWETTKETAEVLKEKGYFTFSSYADTFRLYGNSIEESWVKPGETTIRVDQKIMDWVNDSKEWLDAGYLDETVKGQFNADWNKAMGTKSKVFAFLLPAWGIDFVLKPNWDGEEGEWAVTNPPQEYNWGGSYIHGCQGTDNPEHVKDIIMAMTGNKENLLKFLRIILILQIREVVCRRLPLMRISHLHSLVDRIHLSILHRLRKILRLHRFPLTIRDV